MNKPFVLFITFNQLVNVFLTDNQRNWLLDEYLNQLATVDATLIDDAHEELIHMKNPEFYDECREFMPHCMQELKATGIR